jgi:hypothetical protein
MDCTSHGQVILDAPDVSRSELPLPLSFPTSLSLSLYYLVIGCNADGRRFCSPLFFPFDNGGFPSNGICIWGEYWLAGAVSFDVVLSIIDDALPIPLEIIQLEQLRALQRHKCVFRVIKGEDNL